MANRSSPEGGYGFGRKRHYRRQVWKTIRSECRKASISIPDAHALLMPSVEGDEIDVALASGFREQHLHVVDRNPAIVAVLKRRYPRIQTYGVELDRAAARVAQAGVQLSAANLDLCGQVSVSVVDTLARFSTAGCLHPAFACVAVTVLRGREHRGFASSVRGMFEAPELEWDALRLKAIVMGVTLIDRAYPDVYQPVRADHYLWAVHRTCQP